MQLIKNKLRANKLLLIPLGILILLFSAVALLWSGRANSNQAISAMIAKVYFDGEYRIADGSWEKIVSGQHIRQQKVMSPCGVIFICWPLMASMLVFTKETCQSPFIQIISI